ncbi:MAG: hypothetical protein AAF191_15485, partial [Verrucomicrobiota bacterium]
LFLWADSGLLTVAEAATGNIVHGPKRVEGNYFSNPLLLGKYLYCGNRDRNELVVLRASEDYEEVARNPVGDGINATPAVVGGRLFVRTNSELICFGKR